MATVVTAVVHNDVMPLSGPLKEELERLLIVGTSSNIKVASKMIKLSSVRVIDIRNGHNCFPIHELRFRYFAKPRSAPG